MEKKTRTANLTAFKFYQRSKSAHFKKKILQQLSKLIKKILKQTKNSLYKGKIYCNLDNDSGSQKLVCTHAPWQKLQSSQIQISWNLNFHLCVSAAAVTFQFTESFKSTKTDRKKEQNKMFSCGQKCINYLC